MLDFAVFTCYDLEVCATNEGVRLAMEVYVNGVVKTMSEETIQKIDRLKSSFEVQRTLIERLIPPSRQRSLAITKLEEATMWSIQGLIYSDDE